MARRGAREGGLGFKGRAEQQRSPEQPPGLTVCVRPGAGDPGVSRLSHRAARSL